MSYGPNLIAKLGDYVRIKETPDTRLKGIDNLKGNVVKIADIFITIDCGDLGRHTVPFHAIA